ncbi:MAG TPA: hypothetical protein VFQ53_33990 [Kofleriaceae bacterium]|nr:hypothetical protein [Kofleriaceae bacterium]
MKRVKQVLAIAIPSLLAGGLLFHNTFGHAATGDDDNDDARQLPAAKDPWGTAPTPPTPPAPPSPFTPPAPPGLPHRVGHGNGVSIRINGNHVQIDGIDDLVEQQLDAVRQMLAANPNLPPDVRAKITARMDKVKSIVNKRLRNIKTTDLDQLEEQLDSMGQELETAMEGLDEDLSQLGDKLSRDVAKNLRKSFAKQFKHGKLQFDFDHQSQSSDDDDDDADADDDDDVSGRPSMSVDDDDVPVAVDALKGVTITKAQRDQIRQLRATGDAQIAEHRKQLDEASERLEAALADPRTSDADIAQYVDQISMHEAAIRKARLLTWVNARRMLDADQVRKIEDAARKRSR